MAQPERADGPTAAEIDEVVVRELAEDEGSGDLTSAALPSSARARARLVAKAPGVFCGAELFARTFRRVDSSVEVVMTGADGDRVEPGQELGTIVGPARALLVAERTALNFAQRLSGIATLTRAMVDAADPVRVLDTRKTTPGLRRFEKYAVVCGGGENHRYGLWDQVLVKENHVELSARPMRELVETLRNDNPDVLVTVEARDETEALAAVGGGADVVMLDNMAPAEMARVGALVRAAAEERGRGVELEASGGVTLQTIGEVARASGVDRISVGALTHSAPALDLALYLEPA